LKYLFSLFFIPTYTQVTRGREKSLALLSGTFESQRNATTTTTTTTTNTATTENSTNNDSAERLFIQDKHVMENLMRALEIEIGFLQLKASLQR
jgi:hypothetical protein